jgi:3-methyladenine DNA glycosylase/8-oxoguanine DNA glycosylase
VHAADRWRAVGALDLLVTLEPFRYGNSDPCQTVQLRPGGFVVWRATTMPSGPVTAALRRVGDDVAVDAWGAGAVEAVAASRGWLGEHDDRAGFDASAHPVVERLDHARPGLRVGRSGQVLDAAVAAVLGQQVTGVEAYDSWRRLVLRFGSPAPVPSVPTGVPVPRRGLWLPPTVGQWRRVGFDDLLAAGVTPQRARTLQRVVSTAAALERTLALPDRRSVDAALRSVPGIGVWTSAEIRQRAHGDADAVSVGDYHLAHHIGWALTGRRVDDAGMLELLRPWVGHRYRVQRLVEVSDVAAPRHGPRMSLPTHRPGPRPDRH